MIQTVRDAEVKIGLLEREITKIKHEFRQFKSDHDKLVKDSEPTETKSESQIDSIISADGTQVSHRLYHIFETIKTRFLDIVEKLTVKDLEVSNKTTTKTLEVTEDAKIDRDLWVVRDSKIDGNLNVTGNTTLGALIFTGKLNANAKFSAAGPSVDYTSVTSAIVTIGNTAGGGGNAIYMGTSSIGNSHSWIQATEPGVNFRPLVLNGNGGGLILNVAPGVITDGMIPSGNVFIYQSGLQLIFRVRDTGGTLRTGTMTLV